MKTGRETYKKIILLALPIVIQNLLSATVNSADVVMLNSVGQSSISAVSLATQYSSILYMVFYGLGTGVTMLSAQYWGKKDLYAIELIEGIALRFSVILALVACIGALTVPNMMMRPFTTDEELISIGASYLKCVAVSFVFWSISEIYLSTLRSVGRVTISTVLNVLALVFNVLLNAVFIFGLFGMPRMGAAGVGLATSISRGIQLVACVTISIRSKDVKLRLKNMFVNNKVLNEDFVKLALPAMINDVAWGLAFAVYSAILGHLGSDMVAANSIVTVVRNYATVLCFGFASASTIWIGNILGQNDMERAKKDAGRFVKLTIITGLFGCVMVLIASPFVLANSALTEQALYYMKYMLFINSYYVIGMALNTTLIAGVFRAGGDSRYGCIGDVLTMWCYAVPLGLLSAFVWKLPPLVVYFLLCTDEFAKWPWAIRYYLSFRWVKNITKEY